MYRKKRLPCILSLIGLFVAFSGFRLTAVDLQLDINPVDFLSDEVSTGVQVVAGLWDNQAIALSDKQYLADEKTELLLHFNDSPVFDIMDARSAYSVEKDGASIQGYESYRGGGSAMFLAGQGVDLQAGTESMFAPGSMWNDFTVEFWLYPAVFRDGETLLEWNGTSWLENAPMMQAIEVVADAGRLHWSFDNFFVALSADESGAVQLSTGTIQLESRTEIVPRVWSHHMLRYDSERSVLEYLIDGVSEAVVYVTAQGSEFGDPLVPYVGELSGNLLHIAPNFHGFMDEFRIQREWIETPDLAIAQDSPGFALIGPVDLGNDSVRLTGFDAQYRTPGYTDLRFSIAQRDSYTSLNRNEIFDDSAWTFIEPGDRAQTLNPGESGRYVYFRVEFLPDGSLSNIPLLQDMSVSYNQAPAPPAPSRIQTESGDGSIFLQWNPVVSSDLQGYLLYYGESPGQYFGDDSDLGPSPIDLGNVNQFELSGLINGKMYYFRLASYNTYSSPDRGLFYDRNISREVFARPSRIQE